MKKIMMYALAALMLAGTLSAAAYNTASNGNAMNPGEGPEPSCTSRGCGIGG